MLRCSVLSDACKVRRYVMAGRLLPSLYPPGW
jgi:hypothetical protein